jgi:ketosteroid isomerase-like protein
VNPEDLEAVRLGIEAYNRGDVEDMIEYCDPAIEMVPVRSRMAGGAYSGHDGVRAYMADMDEDWAERKIDIEEIRDLGDSVLVLGVFGATGRSGTEVSYPVAWHSRMREGKLVRMTAYTDRDAALRELGLAS